jgi:hypothetical protein
MAIKAKREGEDLTLIGTLAFAQDLWNPSEFRGSGKPRHGATLILPKSDETGSIKLLQERVAEILEEQKWKASQLGDFFYHKNEDGYTNADGEVYEGFEPTNAYIRAYKGQPKSGTLKRPALVDRSGEDIQSEQECSDLLHSGALVAMIVSPWANNYEGKKQLNCSLRGVQFIASGKHLGGGGSAPKKSSFLVIDETEEVESPF